LPVNVGSLGNLRHAACARSSAPRLGKLTGVAVLDELRQVDPMSPVIAFATVPWPRSPPTITWRAG
jgi:hypothetical protein